MTAITATPKSIRPHVMVAEIEAESGYRYWSEPMSKAALNLWVDKELKWEGELSDFCCASSCWCAEDEGK
jgi:hypothetical protein